jgi:transposase
MNEHLFEKGVAEASAAHETSAGKPRLRVPQRGQVEMQCSALDELLEPDHRARLVWAAVSRLSLEGWLAEIRAVEGHVGRDATDPRLLVALWVYATLDAVGSARELARLCTTQAAYRWLCGGVSVNYHLLADFRTRGGERWDELLTQLVAALLAEGLVTMQCVAQDGMRVRASAGKASYRSGGRLEQFLAQAWAQVETLKQLAEQSPEEFNQRRRAARQRAAEERLARLEEALRQCQQAQVQQQAAAKKSGRAPRAARASTTDPEARVMQFSDGGFRPGYNVQFCTATESGIIVGVEVTPLGSDFEQLPPMLGQLQARYGQTPASALVDGGFAACKSIERAADVGCAVYAPLKEEQKQLEQGNDPYAKKPNDGVGVAAWRARMGTTLAKQIYKLRCQTAEWVNALARNRGLRQLPVRGLQKSRTVATLYAIAHNVNQAWRLRQAAEQTLSGGS